MSEEKRLARLGMSHLIDKPEEMLAETNKQLAVLRAKSEVCRQKRLASGVTPRRTPKVMPTAEKQEPPQEMEGKAPVSTPAALTPGVMHALLNLGVAVANAKPGEEPALIPPKPR